MKKSVKAGLISGAVGLCLAIPVGYRAWLDATAGGRISLGLGQVKPFLERDEAGVALTAEALAKSMTLVMNVPASCADNSCQIVAEQMAIIDQWIHKNLLIRYAEEKNDLNLLGFGKGFQSQSQRWRRFSSSPTAGGIIPESLDTEDPVFVVIDPWLNFIYAWRLDQPIKIEEVSRVLSRTTFDQYLGNYLARRTFMGPKRDPR